MRPRFFYILACLLLAGLPMRAEVDTARHLRVEIISGQMIHANRAGKSVCFLLLGADRGLLEVAAIAAVDQLDQDIIALRDGDDARGIYAETDAQAAALLTSLARVTRPFTISARQIVAGDLHRVPMRLFLDGVPRIAAGMDAVVDVALDGELGAGSAGPAVMTVQEQGALVQGILRDACLLRVGLLDPEGMQELQAAMARFNANMTALLEGDAAAGIAPAGTLKIEVTLKKVRKYWDKVVPVVEATLNHEDVTLKQLQKASIHGDLLEKSLVKLRDYYWAL